MTDTQTLQQVISDQVEQRKSLATLLAVELTDPGAYARFRMEDGIVITGVVEARDDDTDYQQQHSASACQQWHLLFQAHLA
jgi:bifunctional N-acetylglucosamine-1-phosphate-uridyltransferase/glucosamine-1-phosphate-acetyltransferase GlmU-like protein